MNIRIRHVFCVIVIGAMLIGCGGQQSPPVAEGLQVSEGWVRATPPVSPVAAGYLRLHNPGKKTLRVIGLQSPLAARVESHDMMMENGQMRMRATELVLAPGESLSLEPGGKHLMFFEPAQPFEAGGSVPLVIEVDDGTRLMLDLPVRDSVLQESGHEHHH